MNDVGIAGGGHECGEQIALAGFADADLEITQERNVLVVKGQKTDEKDGEYLHRGIAGRAFERRFELADHVKVENASLTTGLLSIELKREIPEAMKPRKIAIGSGAGAQAPLQIEGESRTPPNLKEERSAVLDGAPVHM
ncbi:Hsp20 family protein [Rhizobium laguerreae]|uniref:Hsp20 family protein n=1 Tax=Rhizobium TaxID=379 RepID=UPI0035E4229F